MPGETHTVRRVATTHTLDDRDGRHVANIDQIVSMPSILEGRAFRTPIFTHLGAPGTSTHHINSTGIERSNGLTSGVTLKHGVASCVMDMDPGAKISMHRTESIDHGVIVSGSVWMVTPDGNETQRTLLRAGDTFVQRGTAHGWEAGADGVRFFTVMVDAKPVEIESTGQKLEEFW